MKPLNILLIVGGIGLVGGVLLVYSGVFNVAADEPHSTPVYWLLESVRDRSIAAHARGIAIPPLTAPAMITAGGADYNEMCTGCHLKPGVEESELASAMYPRPPSLAQGKHRDPAETFWIVKHGIKMSGMPAWGATHDDQRLWAMVAFLQQLPRLTPAQYQILTAREDTDQETHMRGHPASEEKENPTHHEVRGEDEGHEHDALPATSADSGAN